MALLSPLDIISAASLEIGEEPIGSLDEESFGGEAASTIYETVVDFNLGLSPFSFAIEFRQLSRETAGAPFSGFEYVFAVPAPTLGPPRYFTDDPTDPDRRFSRYALSGGKVHASVDPLYAAVKFRPDPHQWPPCFRAVTITGIAARLAMALASDSKTHDQLMRRGYGTPQENFRGGEMKAALNEDGQATPPRRANWDNNPLTRAWRSG